MHTVTWWSAGDEIVFPCRDAFLFPLFFRESMSVQPRLLSVAELSHHLAESYLTCTLYVQEMLQYKRQNHGKVTEKREKIT